MKKVIGIAAMALVFAGVAAPAAAQLINLGGLIQVGDVSQGLGISALNGTVVVNAVSTGTGN